ncbi:hypothetical protein NEMIN01_0700 [Nematocida minor]|uniref:uncharacterized protein n=1 Tax=Nematocida minor TaxID=1912983 RepID=UPI00221FDD88|nr:uncharacterized protein NEMIN01_0700 [Nematocida minor]KAI5189837.1 hypothetical protein NEMIN01_0700 [Nematocida minor]
MENFKDALEKLVTFEVYQRKSSQARSDTMSEVLRILKSCDDSQKKIKEAIQHSTAVFMDSVAADSINEMNISLEDKKALRWAFKNAFPVDMESHTHSLFASLVKMYKSSYTNDSMGNDIEEKVVNDFIDLVISEISFWMDIRRYALDLEKETPFGKSLDKKSKGYLSLLELALDTSKVYAYKLEEIKDMEPLLEKKCQKISYNYIVGCDIKTLCEKIESSKLLLSRMIDRSIQQIKSDVELKPEWDPYFSEDVQFLKGIYAKWNGYAAVCYNFGSDYYLNILDAYKERNSKLIWQMVTEYNSYARSLEYVHMPLSECTSERLIFAQGDPHARYLFSKIELNSDSEDEHILECIVAESQLEDKENLTKTQIALNLLVSTVLGISAMFFMFASSIIGMDVFTDSCVNLNGFRAWDLTSIFIFLGWRSLCVFVFAMCMYIVYKQIKRWLRIIGVSLSRTAMSVVLIFLSVSSIVTGYLVCFYSPDILSWPETAITLYTMAAVFKVANLIDIIVRKSTSNTKETIRSTWPSSVAVILIFLIVFFMNHVKSITTPTVVL